MTEKAKKNIREIQSMGGKNNNYQFWPLLARGMITAGLTIAFLYFIGAIIALLTK